LVKKPATADVTPTRDASAPSRSDSGKRRILKVMLTDTQHTTLKMAATAEGKKLANYVREVAYEAATARVKQYFDEIIAPSSINKGKG